MNEPNRKSPDQALATIASPEMQQKFLQVLPSNISADRFTRVTLVAIQQDPSILECDRQSLYNACLTAAQRGLLPDKKEGALVAFNTKVGDQWVKKAQFMAMPEGIIKELAKAGVKVYATSVYAKDKIEIWNDDDGQHVRHVPDVFGDRGERVGAFAAAKDADGRSYVEAMNLIDLTKARNASKSKDKQGNPTGPWKEWPERMEQKTVLHRIRKRIAILGHDDIVERLQEDETADVADVPEAAPAPAAAVVTPIKPPTNRPKGLQSVIEHDAGNDEPPPDDMVEDDDSDPFGPQ
jgi:phage RecT family recombinase